jgi:hypothetical protein
MASFEESSEPQYVNVDADAAPSPIIAALNVDVDTLCVNDKSPASCVVSPRLLRDRSCADPCFVSKWDVDDVCAWLRSVGLNQLASTFVEHRITGTH